MSMMKLAKTMSDEFARAAEAHEKNNASALNSVIEDANRVQRKFLTDLKEADDLQAEALRIGAESVKLRETALSDYRDAMAQFNQSARQLLAENPTTQLKLVG